MRSARRPVVMLLLAGLLSGLLSGALAAVTAPTAEAAAAPPTYTNPLAPRTASGARVDSCPDPSVLRGRARDAGYWYMYCTSNPLNDRETSGRGAPVGHRLPMLRSRDLVHWTFVGSALAGKPSWAADSAKLWAPDVVYSRVHRRYYLTFAVTDTKASTSGQAHCTSDSAIGVATSSSPTGPWHSAGRPLVAPRRLGAGCAFADTIDPDVLGASIGGTSTVYWGSFRGGILAQPVRLSRTGMRLTGRATQLTVPSRFEAPNVVLRGGFYYLFVSANGCCNGALSGYGVFAGRSASPYGPFLDQQGNSLLAPRAGGTPVLTATGNRWVGPGHNTVFQDRAGQWWTIYHAIDRFDPFFATEPGYTRRPAMMDPVDWPGGWPSVRSGAGASTGRMPGPAARPGQRSRYRPVPVAPDVPGAAVPAATDSFDVPDGTPLDPRWTWLRPPASTDFGIAGGELRIATAAGSLTAGTNDAPVLSEAAPVGDYVVQTEVRMDVPLSGVHDFVQAGLAIYRTDDEFVKLTHSSLGSTRVTAFAKEVPAGARFFPRSGNMTVGPPADTTWLRLVRRGGTGPGLVTAYTSQDGLKWIHGGTWSVDDRGGARIALLSMGGAGFNAWFSDVQVATLG